MIAQDGDDVDLNRLCLFACKYGYCPDEVCTTVPADNALITDDDDSSQFGYEAAMHACMMQRNSERCPFKQDHSLREYSVMQCYNFCKPHLDAAAEAEETSNYRSLYETLATGQTDSVGKASKRLPLLSLLTFIFHSLVYHSATSVTYHSFMSEEKYLILRSREPRIS